MYDFSAGSNPYGASVGNGALNWYTAFEPNILMVLPKWVVNDDCLGQACQSLAWPDNNGHNYFWDYGANPFGLFGGVWSKVEMAIKWTNQADGYVKQWQDGVLVINYSGATDNYGGTDRSESVGGYARMYGEPNNWRYWADVYLDYSLARVVLADNADLTKATIVEPQIPSSWSPESINVSVNLGKFAPGDYAYLFVCDPTGVCNETGFRIPAGN